MTTSHLLLDIFIGIMSAVIFITAYKLKQIQKDIDQINEEIGLCFKTLVNHSHLIGHLTRQTGGFLMYGGGNDNGKDLLQ